MDIEKRKRNRMIRLIVTEVVMVVAIVLIVGVLVAVANGWRLNKNLGVEQNGLVQINSLPNGATIEIDGETLFAKTDASKMLMSGKHLVKLTKNGYDGWAKQIEVTPGWLLRLKYPRLFKQRRVREQVRKYGEMRFLKASPNRNLLLYAVDNSTRWQLMSIRDDEIKVETIDLMEFLTKTEKGGLEIKEMIWNDEGTKLILAVDKTEGREWIILDLLDLIKSVNLTRNLTELRMKNRDNLKVDQAGDKIEKVRWLGRSSGRVAMMISGRLHSLDLNNSHFSEALALNVADFAAEEKGILFVTKTDETKNRMIGLIKEGERKIVEVKKVEEDKDEVYLAIGEFEGGKIIAFTVGKRWYIYRGEDFPDINGGIEEMKLVVESDLKFAPQSQMKFSPKKDLLAINGEKMTAMFDTEVDKYYEYQIKNTETKWLDDYLVFEVKDGRMIGRDFDGSNARILAKEAVGKDYDAVITASNRWLYFVTEDGSDKILQRERL